MRHRQLLLCDGAGLLVSSVCIVSGLILVFTCLVLRDVAVVITLHLVVEDFRLAIGGLGDEVGGHQVEDAVANFVQFTLHLLFVLIGVTGVLSIALGRLLLPDTRDDTPGCATAADGVFVGNRQ